MYKRQEFASLERPGTLPDGVLDAINASTGWLHTGDPALRDVYKRQALERHEDLLSYEEFLQVAQAAVELGITRFKVTGGEPLVRRGCVEFLRRLKALPGVEQVTLTTNGVRLAPLAPELAAMGLDGVNISLDAADPTAFANICLLYTSTPAP